MSLASRPFYNLHGQMQLTVELKSTSKTCCWIICIYHLFPIYCHRILLKFHLFISHTLSLLLCVCLTWILSLTLSSPSLSLSLFISSPFPSIHFHLKCFLAFNLNFIAFLRLWPFIARYVAELTLDVYRIPGPCIKQIESFYEIIIRSRGAFIGGATLSGFWGNFGGPIWWFKKI